MLYQLAGGQCSNSSVRYLLKLVDVRSIEPSRHRTQTYNRKVHYVTGKAYLKHIFFSYTDQANVVILYHIQSYSPPCKLRRVTSYDGITKQERELCDNSVTSLEITASNPHGSYEQTGGGLGLLFLFEPTILCHIIRVVLFMFYVLGYRVLRLSSEICSEQSTAKAGSGCDTALRFTVLLLYLVARVDVRHRFLNQGNPAG